MKAAIGLIGIVFVLVLALQLGPGIAESIELNNRYNQAQRAFELEQKMYEAQRQKEIDAASVGADKLATNFYKVIVPVLLLVTLGIVAHMYQKRSEPLVLPDHRGLLPLPRSYLFTLDENEQLKEDLFTAYQLYLQTGQLHAIHQPGQTPHVYSPHTTHNPTFAPRYTTTKVDLDENDSAGPDGPNPDVPPFSKLLQQGAFGGSNGIMLGITSDEDTGEPKDPIYGTDDDIASAVIGGMRGSGKTTTACFIAGQWTMFNGKLVVCDPHGRAEGPAQLQTLAYNLSPLEHNYAVAVAIDNDEILESARYVKSALERRIRGGSYDDRLMLIIDEFSTVMREGGETAEIISDILEKIATNGRKFHVTAALLGQQWHVKRAGGGPLKDVLATAWIHRMLRKTANQIIPLGAEMPSTEKLQPGEAYFYRGLHHLEHIYIPYTTREDLLLLSPRKAPVSEESVVYGDRGAEDARTRRIVELFKDGVDPTAIVEEVFQIKGGRAFKVAIAEVYATIRRELG